MPLTRKAADRRMLDRKQVVHVEALSIRQAVVREDAGAEVISHVDGPASRVLCEEG